MRRINEEDERAVIDVIQKCPARSCTWETIRHKLAESHGGLEQVWTRQALKAHQGIYSAYLAQVQSRRTPGTSAKSATANNSADNEAAGIQAQLQDLQRKYDALAMQHRKVIYNASLLPGGLKLLIDPLPQGQQERSSSKPAGRHGKR